MILIRGALGDAVAPDNIVKTNPDPTEAVKEALTLAIKNLDEKFSAQLKANDTAVLLARQELKDQLLALDANIANKFLSNKDLVDQLGVANAAALSAALLTQKEMANKSEAAMADTNKATNEKIDRLTSRLDMGEGRGFGAVESKQDRTTDKSHTVALAAVLIALAALLFGVVMALRGH
jgi:NADH dehydrogenase/NADH:ubiquinone oxidoreductase subunit G